MGWVPQGLLEKKTCVHRAHPDSPGLKLPGSSGAGVGIRGQLGTILLRITERIRRERKEYSPFPSSNIFGARTWEDEGRGGGWKFQRGSPVGSRTPGSAIVVAGVTLMA